MKKRKFIKIAGASTLAALAGISLVACGNDTESEKEYTVVFNSNDPDTTDQITPNAYADIVVKKGGTINLPTPSYEGYTFDGWFVDSSYSSKFNSTDKVTSNLTLYAKWTKNGEPEPTPTPTPTTTYTITFDTNGHGTAPAAVTGVTAIPSNLPTITVDGYRFIGWGTSASATTAVAAGTAITENTTLYAIWEQMSLYEIYAASQDKVYATQFEEAIVAPSIDTYDGESQGIFSVSDQTNELKVEVTGGKLAVTDASTSKAAEARIQIGYLYSGVLEGTLTHKFTKSASKQDLISFYGSADLASETKLFALKTDTNKKVNVLLAGPKTDPDDSSKKWGDLQTHYVGTPVTFVENEEVNIYYKYEFETGKLTIKYNNQAVLTDYVLPLTTTYGTTQMAIRPLFITGFGFMTGGTATDRAVYVDDFALINTGKGDLAATKTYMISRLDSLYQFLDVEHKYTINGADITALYNSVKAGINAATSANDAADAFIAFAEYKAIKSDEDVAEELEAYKTTAKGTISTLKTTLDIDNNYSVNKTAVEAIFTDANTAIDAATSKSAVDAIVAGVSTSVAAIKSDATLRAEAVTELAEYKESKLTEIASDIAQDKQADCIAAVNTAYETQITSLNTCAMTDLNTTLAAAKTALDNVVNSYKKTIAELQAELEANLQAYKATTITPYSTTDEIENALIQAVNAITLDWTNKDTIDLCNAEYDAKVAEIDALVATHVAKVQAKAELDNYVTTALEELKLVQEGEYATSEYKTEVDTLVATQKSNIQDATDIASALTAAKAAVDAKILEIKAATELTVTFVNGNETVDTQVVLKGHTATASTVVPTKTGYAFKAWYADENQETAFDFTTTINSATTIYAGWYDTYGQAGTTSGFANPTAIPTIDNWTFTGMVVQATSITGVDKDNNEFKYTSSIKFGGDSKNTRYITITLTESATVFLAQMGGGSGDRSVFINKTAPTSSKASALDTTYIYATSSGQAFASATATLEAGTYYVQTYGGDCRILALQITTESTYVAVTGITATATAGEDSISVSDVKLQPVSGDAFAITEGYTVTVKDSNNNIVSDYSQNLEAGTYTVTVKYGTYTVSLPYEVEIEAAVTPVYEDITYVWNGAECTATRVCTNVPDLTVTETVTGVLTEVTPAAVNVNQTAKYVATFNNTIFTTQESETFAVPDTAIAPIYAEITYVWNGAECTATKECTNDSKYTITETVTGVQIVDTAAAVGVNRKDKYVATFTKTEFEVQESEPFEVADTAITDLATAEDLIAAVEIGGTYTLTADVNLTTDLVITEDLTLDLNGHNVTFSGWGFEANGAELTINGNGNVTSAEAALYARNGGTLVINGGTYTATENFVVGTNGSEGQGGNTITITAGTFNGSMAADGVTAGYIAGGIYVANNDTVTITGGTINVTDGAGIIARSGSTTVGADVVFNVTGDGTLGKVGDSNVTVPTGQAIVLDYAANYPGGNPTLTNNNAASVYALVDDETSLVAANGIADTIVLASDITLTARLTISEDVVLDLNDKTITTSSTNIIRVSNDTDAINVTIKNGTITGDSHVVRSMMNATVTLDDITVTATGIGVSATEGTLIIENATINAATAVVAYNGANITIKDGAYTASEEVVIAQNGSTITIKAGQFQSTADIAMAAVASTLIIDGGTVNAQEAAVMAFDAGTVEINGGTFTTVDNFVVGTNGTEGRGANSITINGGTFNGNITTSGYVACGVYVANSDTVNINGGTFNITNGVGVLARSGSTTVGSDVEFNVTGDGTLGKVGDSKVTVPSGQVIVIDYAANYPGGEPTVTNNTSEAAYILVDDEDSFVTAINTVGSYIVLNDNITLTGYLMTDLNGTVTVIVGDYYIDNYDSVNQAYYTIRIGANCTLICDVDVNVTNIVVAPAGYHIVTTPNTDGTYTFTVEADE